MSSPKAPPPPDYAAANRAAIMADIETLPMRYEAMAEWEPRIAQLMLESQAASADKVAESLLEVQKKYGPDFIEQRLKEMELSDPEGVQARRMLAEAVMGDLEKSGEPTKSGAMSGILYEQLMDELGMGGDLTDDVRRELQQGVRGAQAARGNILGNAAIYEEAATTGSVSEARRRERQQAALQFLTSGASPDDIHYRERQQALGNVGSFLSGATPTAQFAQLSGAQQGAAPFAPQAFANPLNPNAGAQGTQFAMQSYQAQSQVAAQQVNPWVAGLSLAIGGASSAGRLGWQPFGP